jgi:hypothetical protein
LDSPLAERGHRTTDTLIAWSRSDLGQRNADRAVSWPTTSPSPLYLPALDAHALRHPRLTSTCSPSASRHVPRPSGRGPDQGHYGEGDRRQIVALYDAALRYIDDQGARARSAARNEQLNRTVIVVSAVGGESSGITGASSGQSSTELCTCR